MVNIINIKNIISKINNKFIMIINHKVTKNRCQIQNKISRLNNLK